MLLPVLGTVLVLIAGGAGGLAVGPVAALRHPAAQWIGHRSYTIYLWHWPALVLFAARYGPLSLAQRLAVVALSVGLAAATTAYIEDPVRHLRWLAVRPARGLALGGALCSLALGVGGLARATGPSARFRGRRRGPRARRRGPGPGDRHHHRRADDRDVPGRRRRRRRLRRPPRR